MKRQTDARSEAEAAVSFSLYSERLTGRKTSSRSRFCRPESTKSETIWCWFKDDIRNVLKLKLSRLCEESGLNVPANQRHVRFSLFPSGWCWFDTGRLQSLVETLFHICWHETTGYIQRDITSLWWQNQVFKAETWSFLNSHWVVFEPKPNETIMQNKELIF